MGIHDEPIVHYDAARGLWVYRASAIGGCEDALVAARSGMTGAPPPDDFQQRFDDGHANEHRVIDLWLDTKAGRQWLPLLPTNVIVGDGITRASDSQVVSEWTVGVGAVIRGHADEIVWHEQTGLKSEFATPYVRRVLEVKAFAKSRMREFENGALSDGKGLWEKYRWQLSALMTGLGMGAVFVAGEKDDEGVVQRVEFAYVDASPVPRAKLMARVARVEARAVSGDPLVCTRGDYPCPFHFIHVVKDVDVATVEDEELEGLLTLRATFKLQEETAKGELKGISDLIGKLLEKHGRRVKGAKTRVGKWEVTWMEVEQPASTRKGYVSKYAMVKER